MCSHKEPPGNQDLIPHSLFSRVRYYGRRYLSGYGGEEYCFIYHLVVVGDADTGKSSMFGRFTGAGFDPTYSPTPGTGYSIRFIELDEVRIKLQMRDLAGQPHHRDYIRSFYRSFGGIIITYNATKEETFESVPYWIEEISKESHPDTKIVLVGTNSDRVDEKVVDYTRARDFARERQIPFFEVSSKDGTNVELAFMTLVAQLRQLQIQNK